MTAIEVLNQLLDSIVHHARPGKNLLALELQAERLMLIMGATSANKGYQPQGVKVPFPSILCLSVNDEIGHAPARDYILKDGDLLTIDCGLFVDNLCADAGLTMPIGTVSSRDLRLLRYTKRALKMGISQIRTGVKITEVGRAIEKCANQNGFVVVKRMAGHGIGQQMHMEPVIPMFDFGIPIHNTPPDPVFYEGQIVCIEPHLTYKDEFGILDSDGWTLRTRDKRKSAMFESMCKVTSLGAEILTKHINFNES